MISKLAIAGIYIYIHRAESGSKLMLSINSTPEELRLVLDLVQVWIKCRC
jgi:hypothetical protein